MDQLKLRTEELQMAASRCRTRSRVDVKNAVERHAAGARALRNCAGEHARLLADQSLEAEQQRFKFGAPGADVTTVIQAQQDLANDQSLEVQAMASYIHARIDFDQALGQTIEKNNIRMEEAMMPGAWRAADASRDPSRR